MNTETTPKDDGGPAFPMQDAQAIHAYAAAKTVSVDGSNERDRVYLMARAEAIRGMSLRDHFAAKALAGLASMYHEHWTPESAASTAYELADAMLKARSA